jgi:hypothetical protein
VDSADRRHKISEENIWSEMGQRSRSKPSREEVELSKYVQLTRTVGASLESFFKWGSLLGIAYFAYRGVDKLAGKMTIADLRGVISWPSGPEWWIVALALLFGVGGILYGNYQRRIRQDVILRYNGIKAKEERLIDPRRSSSKLTQLGGTRPEDK